MLIGPDFGDNGLMRAQTQTIYTSSIATAPDLVLFGLVVHEAAHAWEISLDYDANDLATENVRVDYPSGAFTTSLEPFGWTVDVNSAEPSRTKGLYVEHFYETTPNFLFDGVSPAGWEDWFDQVSIEYGDEYLASDVVTSRNLVGPWSLRSPWEWHADHLQASVYNRMHERIDHPRSDRTTDEVSVLRQEMIRAVQGQWPNYDFRNAVGTEIDRELTGFLRLSDEEFEALVTRYVVPLISER